MVIKIPKIETRNKYWNKRFLEGAIYNKNPSKLAHLILKYLENTKPQKILVTGGGYGRNAVFFAKNKFFITSTDVAKNAIKLGKKYFANFPNLIFLQDNILKSKIKNRSFDFVISLYILSLFSDKEVKIILNKIKKILIPNGMFICNFLSKKDYEYKTENKIDNNIILADNKKQLINFYSKKEVVDLLKSNGLKVLKISEVSEKKFINIYKKEVTSYSWFVVCKK
jgi:2-polyprenyl-3-methyl-5-hydroxy-6-metoxy-1,4-benzoquinol methylase